jgi:hypothetical protein
MSLNMQGSVFSPEIYQYGGIIYLGAYCRFQKWILIDKMPLKSHIEKKTIFKFVQGPLILQKIAEKNQTKKVFNKVILAFFPPFFLFFRFVSKQICLFRLFRYGSETPKRTETNQKNNLLVS